MGDRGGNIECVPDVNVSRVIRSTSRAVRFTANDAHELTWVSKTSVRRAEDEKGSIQQVGTGSAVCSAGDLRDVDLDERVRHGVRVQAREQEIADRRGTPDARAAGDRYRELGKDRAQELVDQEQELARRQVKYKQATACVLGVDIISKARP